MFKTTTCELKCIHGQSPAKKVCAAPECNAPALFALGCEQCDSEHSHQGCLIIRNWQPLRLQLARLAEPKHTAQLMQVAGSIGCLTQLFSDLQGMLARDLAEMESSSMSGLPQKFKIAEYANIMTGRDVSQLLEHFSSDTGEQNEQLKQSKHELTEQYKQFLNDTQELYSRFVSNRAVFVANAIKKIQGFKEAKCQSQAGSEISYSSRQQDYEGETTVPPNPISYYLSRDAEEHKPERESAARKIHITNLGEIQPGQKGLNLHVKVITVQIGHRKELECFIGDHTGCGKALLQDVKEVQKGAELMLTNVEARVIHERIVIVTSKESSISRLPATITKLRTNNNISASLWELERKKPYKLRGEDA